jgi:mannan endo-1,4-beta-mannosidase
MAFLILLLFFAQSGYLTDSNPFTASLPEPIHFQEKTPKPNFVTVKNGHFVLKGKTFRFAGTNAYYLPVYEKINPHFVDKTLAAFEKAGIKVVRMWGFYDGPPQHKDDISFQPKPEVYKNLQYLDAVIAKGKKYHIKFIITLVNFWKELGGICQYNKWAGISSCKLSDAMHEFMTGKKQQKWYKDYIKMLLNHKNVYTKVRNKDNPIIFSWQIINEGRNRKRPPSELHDWYQKIAKYIKSIDPNHMVSTGEEGFDYKTPSQYSVDQYSNTYILRPHQGTSFIQNTSIPEIDYGTAHWYPSGWGWFIKKWGADPKKDHNLIKAQHAWLKDHLKIAHNLGKPLVLGEYGFPGWGDERQQTIYKDFWNTAEKIKLDGSLLWEFTINYRKCYEYGGNICWPGGRKDKKLYEEYKNYIHTMNNM